MVKDRSLDGDRALYCHITRLRVFWLLNTVYCFEKRLSKWVELSVSESSVEQHLSSHVLKHSLSVLVTLALTGANQLLDSEHNGTQRRFVETLDSFTLGSSWSNKFFER